MVRESEQKRIAVWRGPVDCQKREAMDGQIRKKEERQ